MSELLLFLFQLSQFLLLPYASAVIIGAKSQARAASKELFDAGGLGKCKYL